MIRIPPARLRFLLPLRKSALDAVPCARRNYVAFIVLCRSRVGSNLLRGLLNGNPQVVALGEIFRQIDSLDWDHTGYFQAASVLRMLRRDPVRLLDARIFGRYPRSIKAAGFKLFYYHARDGAASAVWQYLRQRTDVRVVHLKRDNLLHTHLSRKRAAMTDRWVNTSGQADAEAPVRVDYEECLDDFRRTRAWERESEAWFSGHAVLPISYESIAADNQREAARVQEFLGVKPCPVQAATFRQARQPLPAAIVNYSELKARFSGTEWEMFFAD